MRSRFPRLLWPCLLPLCLAAASGAATAPAKSTPVKPAAKTAKTATKTASPAKPARAAGATDDPYLWLEDLNAGKSLDWVKQQNARSTHELADTPEFKAMNDRFLEIVNSKARIPTVNKIGDLYYNFWRDAGHERGVWRRTTLAEYRKDQPAWETVLDLDSLATAEKENWVWHSASPLFPGETRCLVHLSRGGADAEVVREFDLTTKSFVQNGFVLPEAKSSISWRSTDAVYVGTDFGPGSLTTSGYPRIAKEWTRGTPLSSAVTVFAGESTDVSVSAFRDPTPGFERDFVARNMTFYSDRLYVRRDGRLIQIEKPDDAEADVQGEWLLLKLRSDWSVGGQTWPAGALIATRFENFLAGKRDFEMLFEPTERRSLTSYALTKNTIILNTLDNVKCKLSVLRYGPQGWMVAPIPGLPEFGTIEVSAADQYRSDEYFLTSADFLTPSSLELGTAGGNAPEQLKQSPSFFDAKGLEVTQHEAVSKDGTKIPYFQVSRAGLPMNGQAPTLLNGYGGFEISELPSYSGIRGSGWLEKGGVFVLANLRGGGEFGPAWHEGGVKEQRHHCYEDMIAVGEDLVKRHVTSPAHLGCIGGSNGGLLVGNMLVMRPDLFGAVVCQAPLLDMKRYHKLLAGASWMGEYGNPDDPKEWAFIKGWSPYQLARKDVKYPPSLFTAAIRDDRVHPGHARKMVAKLEAQGHDVRYYENIEGGHSGSANNREQAYMSALAYTFLWRTLGTATAASAKPAP
jgi:prolyl oligopeptidase